MAGFPTLPATMAAVESLCGGALQRLPKGFAMTNIPVPAARVRQLQTLCYILHTIYSAHAVGDYRLLAQLLSITVDIGDQAFEASNALGALMSKDGGAQ